MSVDGVRGPVAVTGGAGFLGAEVVRQLHAAEVEDVRSVNRKPFPQGALGANSPKVKSHIADIRDGDLAPAFAGAKTVLHLAACQYHTPLASSTYDLPFFEVNVDGTRRTLAAAERAGVERFVFVSTNMVYGLPRNVPLDESHPCEPFGPYGKSKLAAERIVRSFHDNGKMECAIVRPGLIVGPGRLGVFVKMFDWILGNRPVWIIGSGNNRYELISVSDVASLTIAAAARSLGFGAYNCGALSVPTMREWMTAVIRAAGSRSRLVPIPGRPLKMVFRAFEPIRLSPLRKDQYLIADIDYFMDTSKATRELGWRPRMTGLDAVLSTFSWYLSGRGAGDVRTGGADVGRRAGMES